MKPRALTSNKDLIPFLRIIFGLVLTMPLMAWPGATVFAQDSPWRFTTVATEGAKPSLAVEPDGTPHMVFMLEAGSGWVKYARRDHLTGTFQISDIATGYFYGPPALALDSDGIPHIAYHDHTVEDQQHAYLSEQGWVLEQIVSTGHDGWDNSILVDARGKVITSSVDPGGVGVEFAESQTLSWNVEPVGSNPTFYGYGTSIALDRFGIAHIAYFDDETQDLMIASRTGPWAIVTVDSEGDVGRFASLEIGG